MHTLKVGSVAVTWLGHASFMIEGDQRIYIDPFVLPESPKKADLVLVTHDHFDHCDKDKIKKLYAEHLFGPDSVVKKLGTGIAAKPGKTITAGNVTIQVVDAYNTNKPFHTAGQCVGYVIEMDGKRIYHAGDTDLINEMGSLGRIDVAMLPIGGKYTMTPKEAAKAAEIIKPAHLIPMHYDSEKYGVNTIDADPTELEMLLPKGIVTILSPLV